MNIQSTCWTTVLLDNSGLFCHLDVSTTCLIAWTTGIWMLQDLKALFGSMGPQWINNFPNIEWIWNFIVHSSLGIWEAIEEWIILTIGQGVRTLQCRIAVKSIETSRIWQLIWQSINSRLSYIVKLLPFHYFEIDTNTTLTLFHATETNAANNTYLINSSTTTRTPWCGPKLS